MEEITGANLRNFVKAIKLFCEMSDISIAWKKITRGLPKTRRYADDRVPTMEEIQTPCVLRIFLRLLLLLLFLSLSLSFKTRSEKRLT